MRRDLTKGIRVAAGGSVAIRASLQGDCRHARLSLWSAEGDFEEFSPFIPNPEILAASYSSKPVEVRPIYFTLTTDHPDKEVKFVVDREVVFKLVQDIDSKDEPYPKVRIIQYGKAATGFLRKLRDRFRLVRCYSPPPLAG